MTAKINGKFFEEVEVMEIIDCKTAEQRQTDSGVVVRVSPGGKNFLIPFEKITFVELCHEKQPITA